MTKKNRVALSIYERRFETLMKLIRIDKMLRSAKIINQNGKKA